MGHLDHTAVVVNLLLGLRVNLLGLGLHVVIGDKGRANLLVAITRKLLLKRLHRVKTSLLGCFHLELIVHKKGHVVFHTLLVYHSLGIVLVV